jgi:hypothetical protein
MANDRTPNPVYCGSCGARFAIAHFSEDQYTSLQEQLYFPEYDAELRMLLRVKDLYRRYPAAVGAFKMHYFAVLESDDPEVIKKRRNGISPHDIELPPDAIPHLSNLSAEDEATIEWLKQTSFDLEPRLRFVSERVISYSRSVGRVACSQCENGKLQLDPEYWIDPNCV